MNSRGVSGNPWSWLTGLLGVLLLLAAVSAVGARAFVLKNQPGAAVQNSEDLGFKQFHDGAYFPARAILTGVDPYGVEYEEFHPDGTAPYGISPVAVMLHVPFGMLTLSAAEIAYFVTCVLMLLGVVFVVFQSSRIPAEFGVVAMIAGLMILCRPGLDGWWGMQAIPIVAFGFVLAIEYAGRSPLLSGIGTLLTFCEPLIGLVLIGLLLLKGNLRSFVMAIVFVAATLGFAIVAISNETNSTANVIEQMIEVAPSWFLPFAVSPGDFGVGLDTIMVQWLPNDAELWNSVVGRAWIYPLICFGFAGLCLLFERNRVQRSGIASRSGILIALTIVLAYGAQTEYALLLWPALLTLVFRAPSTFQGFSSLFRGLLILLLLIPLYNFTNMSMVLERINIPGDGIEWRVIQSVSAICICTAVVLVGLRVLGSGLIKDPELDFDA